jgi:GT2 family glycosyltransferase
MKVAVIINTHNEGVDLARTVRSYRAAKGDADLRFFIVADGTTDGSCDRLADEPDVVVLKPTDRLGCGQAKHLAIAVALRDFDPDVFFHSDGHNRIIRGTLDLVAVLLSQQRRSHCLLPILPAYRHGPARHHRQKYLRYWYKMIYLG